MHSTYLILQLQILKYIQTLSLDAKRRILTLLLISQMKYQLKQRMPSFITVRAFFRVILCSI